MPQASGESEVLIVVVALQLRVGVILPYPIF